MVDHLSYHSQGFESAAHAAGVHSYCDIAYDPSRRECVTRSVDVHADYTTTRRLMSHLSRASLNEVAIPMQQYYGTFAFATALLPSGIQHAIAKLGPGTDGSVAKGTTPNCRNGSKAASYRRSKHMWPLSGHLLILD